MRKIIIITATGLLVYCVLAFFTGSWIGLQGSKLWILRGALWVLGLAAAGVVVWFFWNKKKREAAAENETPAGNEEIDLLIRDAGNRLSAAGVNKGVSIRNLPVVFVLGPTGSAKTTTVVNCGLEPELLAGQVYQDKDLIPTRMANLWYAQGAVLVEAAGKSVSDPAAWTRIARLLQPGRLRSAVGSGEQAPRAALVMIEAETFIGGGADAIAPIARTLRARLGEISQALGINLPVYVLLTKLDRVPFFAEYVRNLTNDEAAQVLGVTVSMAEGRDGVYAERETTRLSGVFEQLFRSLANARPQLLSREQDPPRLPGIYEFPREFRKVRANLVQFLVDLCRPSQLTVGPFLRGFYFSGVRPVIVNEMAPAQAQRPADARSRDAALHATGMFRAEAAAAAAQASPAKVIGARKVPQWVFLSHFFHHVMLADTAARGASGASTKTSLLRRVLLASAAALCLLYSIALMVSYTRNHSLAATAREAAQGLEAVPGGGVNLESLGSLEKLETLRQSLAVLTGYHRDGAPLSYRWGLYTGDSLYPEVRRLYFDGFRKVLFDQTQGAMVKSLGDLPAAPGPEFGPTYDTLKAYLITTSNHDKSSREFLPPVLMSRWAAARTVDADRSRLAQKQFDFYADELKIENPYSPENHAPTVDKARRYLNQFGGVERVYAAMLAEAGKTNPPFNFNRKYPGSAATLLEIHEVAGGFTKPGWDFVRNSLKDPERYFSGEKWVLGEQTAPGVDRSNIGNQLAARYYADFIKQWRAYLKGASVVKFANLQDASAKLNVLSGNQSPMLALLWSASQNTEVDVPEVANVFQPVRVVTPPKSDLLIAEPNRPYVNALVTLQTSLEAAAGAQQMSAEVAAPTLSNATAARVATRQIAQGFRPDPEGHVESTVQTLMEQPITYVEGMLKGAGPAELNAKGKELCGQFRRLWAKYPFSGNPAAPEATLAEVNAIFRKSDGALWKLYESSLQKGLPKQGPQYVPAPGSGITPGFAAFFNQAASFSEAVYPEGSQDPRVAYSLKLVPTDTVQGVTLTIDAQTMSAASGGGAKIAAKQFLWQGSGQHQVQAKAKLAGGTELAWPGYEGLWAVFQFFGEAESWQPSGSGNALEWFLRTGRKANAVTDPQTGKPYTLRLELDMAGAPPVFLKGYLSKMGCVAEIAK